MALDTGDNMLEIKTPKGKNMKFTNLTVSPRTGLLSELAAFTTPTSILLTPSTRTPLSDVNPKLVLIVLIVIKKLILNFN